MSQKFSIVVEVKNGKPVSSVFSRDKAGDAKEAYAKARDAGLEAYLFLFPTEDKRTKSKEQSAASVSKSVEAEPMPVKAEKSVKDYLAKSKPEKKDSGKVDDLSI